MNTREFLELLLPSSGWIFTATPSPGGNGWINTAHQNLDQAVRAINVLTFEHKAAYFALATYEKDRYWDAAFKNPDKSVGKWRTRTQANAQNIQSFFLDLDVDPADANKFASKKDARDQFEAFRQRVDLPHPMIVDSGGGYHMYWPLAHPMPTGEWRIAADQFKNICLSEGFKADRSLTSDQARVLRALGGYNIRRDAPVRLIQEIDAPIAFSDFKRRLDDFVQRHGIILPVSRVPLAASGNSANDILAGDGGNLGATNDPLHFDRIAFACNQLGSLAATRGEFAGEQLWRAGLGIAKFCEPQDLAYRAISDRHATYDEARTLIKIENWRTGPTNCEHFEQANPLGCDGCPHKGKLTSPAQLGRVIREAPAPRIELVDTSTGITTIIELPKPPEKYKRRAHDGAILMSTEDRDGNPTHEEICPYDFYPTRILRQSGADASIDEHSMWRAHLPRLGIVDMELPQSLISDQRKLYANLLGKGVYMSPEQSKAMQLYMSAYLQKLAADADREKLYDRMGWHESHREFVLGDKVITADGKNHNHAPSRSVRAVTKDGIRPEGSIEGWMRAMQFYNANGYEGHRFFIYAAFGAPLFHMNDTGNKGVLMTASGASGRGKTTCLKACSSIWGEPDALILNGNKDGSTINALYESIGTIHSMPFLWDDITERDPEEIRRFLLNISQGVGKSRMADGKGLNERRVSWETIVLASANTDDVSRIMSSGKDTSPHLMRMVGVEFALLDAGPKAKASADAMLRALKYNYGHAGPLMMKEVVRNYEAIRRYYIGNISRVDNLLNSTNASAERYWSATVAAAYTGAKVAQSLGLLPGFPVEDDLKWMISHLTRQRETIGEGQMSPLELFAEFLETHIGNTLVLSAKGSSNVDNVMVRPYNALLIRHEADANVMYVSRSAVMDYCTEQKTSFKVLEAALQANGVVTNRSALKVLGADTAYAKGQTRAWKIDCKKFGPTPAMTAAVANNVTSINGGKAA